MLSQSKMGVILSGLMLVFAAWAHPAWAFHESGAASCSRCHTTHNSQDGTTANPDSPSGSGHLLRYSTATDVCLSCHATTNGAVMGADPLNPPPELGGGNFVFLLEDNINDRIEGNPPPIGGNHAGHNVASVAWGVPVDPDYSVAPGGAFPSADLTCTSCHDPHGNVNFRMLRGIGKTNLAGFRFVNPAPEAIGISLLFGQESQSNHTAYKSGWTAWCANCHGFYHEQSIRGFDHPVDRLLEQDFADAYNRYNGPNDVTGGDFATAYLAEVPLEDPAMTTSTVSGATTNSRLSCMTCHRAHATSAPEVTRWDPNVEYLDTDGMASQSYPIPNPYADPEQRALCVKCHYQEASSHGFGHPCMQCHAQSGGD